MRLATLGLTAALTFAATPWPAFAQSTGFVTGFPGKDPAGDDAIGWGPAYRPETSFSQPGTPPTPGDFAGAAYRARTGRGPYDAIQGSGLRQARDLRGARHAPDTQVDTQADGEMDAAPRQRRPAHHRMRTRHGVHAR